MNKINFRFTLLEARFPDLYQEAQDKINGDVAPKDIMADWLNELACYRRGNITHAPTEKPIDDIDFAKDVMSNIE